MRQQFGGGIKGECGSRKRFSVAAARLPVDVKALRRDEREVILRPGHCDIQQTALLFYLLRRAGGKIGGNAAIDAG